MKVKYDTSRFAREMDNVMKYSLGFLEGVQKGKTIFLRNIGLSSIEVMKQFVDSNARVDPEMLHHVYEWYKVGSPEARLFDIDYTVSKLGLSFKSALRQSTSVKSGSAVPFYDKARIMEEGIPVRIKPRNSSVLVFDDGGEQVFTKKEVIVENPGGVATQNGLEKTLDIFMNQYFTQSFLYNSGVSKKFSDGTMFKRNMASGKNLGKAKGIETGFRWIANVSKGDL
tara:strand:+ start:2134 stop:2811 length:678 start_codon:yes stop_codon:yes gene_type:complete